MSLSSKVDGDQTCFRAKLLNEVKIIISSNKPVINPIKLPLTNSTTSTSSY